MVATSASAIGHEMSVPSGKEKATMIEFDTFTVKCDFDGVFEMSKVVPIDTNPSKKYTVGREQYEALLRSGVRHTLIDKPEGYKPPIVKVQRK